MRHLEKRSLSVAGHRTSVALESEFWIVLESAARAAGKSLARLIAEQDEARADEPLASRLRLFALRYALASAGWTESAR